MDKNFHADMTLRNIPTEATAVSKVFPRYADCTERSLNYLVERGLIEITNKGRAMYVRRVA